MTSSSRIRSIRRVVRFVQTETDQALLQAVEEALDSQFHGNFSALCKQALRNFLLPDLEGQVISPIAMQGQIVELQERVARLEKMGDRPTPSEPLDSQPSAEPEPPSEVDPLLSRLALLLEDF
jgi:hypothetical protein